MKNMLSTMIVAVMLLASGHSLIAQRPVFDRHDNGSELMKKPHPLQYDWSKYPRLQWGYNDLNADSVPDTLLTVWMGKVMVFIGDDGKLPWPIEDEQRDWNDYFNKAFNVWWERPPMWRGVGSPPSSWSEMRRGWGNYTIMVDRDGCGRLDTEGDLYYKVLDFNGDGSPEAEFCYHFPGERKWANKIHVNLNGEPDLMIMDWARFSYGDEQARYPGNKYWQNVHGSGFFLNGGTPDLQRTWETPIAWYDFDFDGRTNMVMRCGDTNTVEDPRYPEAPINSGHLTEFEIAFELNGNTGPDKYHSLDMQLVLYHYDREKGPSYKEYIDRIELLRGLEHASFLSEGRAKFRSDTVRLYWPYMDGFKLATDFAGWKGAWFIFDEDDDDVRWEEMFAKHENKAWQEGRGFWRGFADKVGDRVEIDDDYSGKGMLYIGKFDGRIHLYGSDRSFWDIDYQALFRFEQGPKAPIGLRYPRVRYLDENGNGFIDTIEYLTAEYVGIHVNDWKRLAKEGVVYADKEGEVERRVSLLEHDKSAGGKNPSGGDQASDVCRIIDPRVDARITGWGLEDWDGNPLNAKSFEGTANKMVFDKMIVLYAKVADDMWSGAAQLHKIAEKHKLTVRQNMDQQTKTMYSDEELNNMKVLTGPVGYSRFLEGKTRRQKYNNGFWLRELVFRDVLDYSGLDRGRLEAYYYTGRLDELCKYIDENMAQKKE